MTLEADMFSATCHRSKRSSTQLSTALEQNKKKFGLPRHSQQVRVFPQAELYTRKLKVLR